ncbi:MAG TPA: UDP-N-acetylglucosamine 1-carboxyvinyltransferase [Phycisphaerae bacterium]|nr:UDP-N-acetylglucosamine 1-carboxyvinyltransferase [Phycisphaerae bacterium]
MDSLVIEGGARLRGHIRINGSKNAALPIMAGALLADGPSLLRDVPNLSDINHQMTLLTELGCSCERQADGAIRIQVKDEKTSHARYDIVRKMRASICALGPLLAKRGYAKISMPGGCAIGDRPVDIHLRGLEALGARIELDGGDIIASASKLVGTEIFLGGNFGSTVLGTANVMSAATLAEGTTVIESAACEPEVVDLAEYLIKMGAKITGHGSPRITIEGVKSLKGAEHRVIPDRIEAGTFMVAAAITNGEVTLDNVKLSHLMAALDKLRSIGVIVEKNNGGCTVASARRLDATAITTQPHPGFPTDLQAQFMALLTIADGNSVITEKIFPDRFLHVAELSRLGARLHKEGATVVIQGQTRLVGAPVMASDLRASAALVVAGLAARGTTTVMRVYHIDRGYEKIEHRLNALGASIKRVNQEELEL